MDRRGAALLQRRLDEAADDTDAVDDGAGDLGRDCVRQAHAGWALVGKPLFRVFQEAVDGAFPSTASAASTPSSHSRTRRPNFHHLTGHYLSRIALLVTIVIDMLPAPRHCERRAELTHDERAHVGRQVADH